MLASTSLEWIVGLMALQWAETVAMSVVAWGVFRARTRRSATSRSFGV